ncbi:pilus assembly protein N-terminal domain-containing protein (plasmid) [Sphingobium sp. V4]|uniref:type II and III secretion system protein family protein n=1 Tax=Sphingobium sp. V4 TaxID=3038927 RepID=UPI0025580993|nr:pilus assembly protein N-terminal domain-containing protein [Sphingobium sp. V4]WIW90620.1 pilus assembly protein N-terminal domain-containing protein [Sphingobium sp. V4]
MVTNLPRAAALALALTAPGIPLATQAETVMPAALHAGTLDIPVNKSQVVSADRPIAKAMVGNADIADVLPLTDRSIYVLGKKMGTTSLTLYDSGGRVMSIMDVAIGPDIEALTRQMRELIPGDQINARISNDSIVLTGIVNSAASSARAVQLAQSYAGDKVINMISMGSSQQVMLEVRFAEVQRSAGKEIGLNSFLQSGGNNFNAVTGSGAQMVPNAVMGEGSLQLRSITDTFGIFRSVFSLGGVRIDGILNALEKRGLSKTLAQPTLVALSGERASFLAGGEFPVPVAQNGTGGDAAISVEFKPFGVSLGFTPTVLSDRTISIIVEPEVSEIDPTVSLDVGNISIPGLRTRRASTTLEMRDGESFAIAGLLRNDYQTAIRQLPLLGALPVIGALFRSTNYQKGETELLIVVTPHLVQPIRPDQVRLPTDRVPDPRESDAFLFGQPYRPLPVVPNGAPTEAVDPAPTSGFTPDPGTAAATKPAKPKEDGYAY